MTALNSLVGDLIPEYFNSSCALSLLKLLVLPPLYFLRVA